MTVNRPKPAVLANHLDTLAKIVRADGDRVRNLAAILAARGWPSATLGNGARSSDTTSSTERAALDPDPWIEIDEILARTERVLWVSAVQVSDMYARIMAHDSDDDPVPGGTGPCVLKTCEHFCNPRKDPEDRLKRGLCPIHYARWRRADQPEMTLFVQIVTSDVA